MKICLTGGAGFIGSNIADAYIAAGHDVLILDDLSTGNARNIPGKARFIQADILQYDLVSLLRDEQVDVLNHHAAQISVVASVANPLNDAQINVMGSLFLFDAAIKAGVKHVIFASTGGAMYGSHAPVPTSEVSPPEPVSPYAISKLAAEHYLRHYSAQHGLKTTVLRYSNVYGPRQNPHGEAGIVAIFIMKLLKGELPEIYGDGENVRDYIYISDVVVANLMILERGLTGTYNCSTGMGTTVNALTSLITAELKTSVTIPHGPSKDGELRTSVCSPNLLCRLLDWYPKTTLEDGIAQTVSWFRQQP